MSNQITVFVSLAVLAELHGQLTDSAGLSDRVNNWLGSLGYVGKDGFDTDREMTMGTCAVLGAYEQGFNMRISVSREAVLANALRLALDTIMDATSLENLYSRSGGTMPIADAMKLIY